MADETVNLADIFAAGDEDDDEDFADSSAETARDGAPYGTPQARAGVRFLVAALSRWVRLRQSSLFRRWFSFVLEHRQTQLDAPASLRSVLALTGAAASRIRDEDRTPASIAGEDADASSAMYDRGKSKAPYPNEKALSDFISTGNRFQRLQGFKFNKDAFASHLRQSQSKVVRRTMATKMRSLLRGSRSTHFSASTSSTISKKASCV